MLDILLHKKVDRCTQPTICGRERAVKMLKKWI
jgi:hypothetical protein